MKSLAFFFSALIFASPTFTQETSPSDDYFTSLFIGTWEHVSSTFPSGNESRYQRDFTFNIDGSGVCAKFSKIDTSYQDFQWQVKDSMVFLFLVDEKSGQKTNTDVKYISLMNNDELYLDMRYAAPEVRKSSFYRRKIVYEVAKY